MPYLASLADALSFCWLLACWCWPASKPAEASWQGISHSSTSPAATLFFSYALSPRLRASLYQWQSLQRWRVSSGLWSVDIVSQEPDSSIFSPFSKALQSSVCYLWQREHPRPLSRLVLWLWYGWYVWFWSPGLVSLSWVCFLSLLLLEPTLKKMRDHYSPDRW